MQIAIIDDDAGQRSELRSYLNRFAEEEGVHVQLTECESGLAFLETYRIGYEDGSYVFEFPDYHVEDKGTYTFDGGTLTLVNANGAETTATGNPLSFTYVSYMSEQLKGDFTISL